MFRNTLKRLQSEFRPQVQPKWDRPFEILRKKWHEIPSGTARVTTKQLLDLPDGELLDLWSRTRLNETAGAGFGVRGWYHLLYAETLRGKRVMDVGSGFGVDGITFAQHGAHITFVDIVESNLAVLRRLCKLLDVKEVNFHYLEDINSLSALPTDYDVLWCMGSLINTPFDVTRAEAQELLKHLPVGGRWIELAYPEARWKREGYMPLDRWGERTDGGAPWMEWYDLDKVRALLSPAEFDVVLYFDFHNNDFNWFDLIRRQ